MDIGIFTNNYLPNPYGVSVSIETFRREFEKRGHNVFIFAPSFKGYRDKNAHVFRYPSVDIEIKFRFPLAIPYSHRMNKVLSNLHLDIIHSQHPNLLGNPAAKWAKKKKIPLVFTWHTLYDKYTNFVPFLPQKLAANYMIKRAVNFANKADAVVVPTDSIVPVLEKWGVKKEMVPIATGVIEDDFKDPMGRIVRHRYGIEQDEIVLLLVSRLTEEKNIKFIFRSLLGILRGNKKVKLLVAGDGYLLPIMKNFAIKKDIQDQVIFSGVAERDEIRNYYAAGDIFVYASKSETQGMILSEAMYMGLPVVAVKATGTTSLVKDNVNGLLVNEDGREFFEAVKKLILDAGLRKKLGEASKKIARESFTSSVCAEKMLALYEETIENYSK